MSTAIHRRVKSLQAGLDPTHIARLPSGWLVLGDPQVFEGYCLLLPDPVVPDLNALSGDARAQFLSDMAACGDEDLVSRSRVTLHVPVALDAAQHRGDHAKKRYFNYSTR